MCARMYIAQDYYAAETCDPVERMRTLPFAAIRKKICDKIRQVY